MNIENVQEFIQLLDFSKIVNVHNNYAFLQLCDEKL